MFLLSLRVCVCVCVYVYVCVLPTYQINHSPSVLLCYFAFLASLGHHPCDPLGLSRLESHMQSGGRAGSNTPTSPSHPSRLWREDGRAATTEARRQSEDRPLHPRRHARSGDIRESEELSHAFCVAPSLPCTLPPTAGVT